MTIQQNIEAELGALMFKAIALKTELEAKGIENTQLHARIAELEAAKAAPDTPAE